ncbi:MAG: hypothetical protein IKX28_05210 [Bacteroidales bacterium]|nr:hypothetical protein [Bacteroidales bacterium]
MKTRKFVVGAPLHIYFRTRGGCVLFYRMTDRLCFCSVLAVLSRRYKVTVIAASLMFTHIHLMVRASDLAQLRLFMAMLIRVFSHLLREDRSLDGPRFQTPFGSAPKEFLKDQRSCLIYILNNPVEKNLCKKAVEDRWTFLAFWDCANPFSERLVKRNVSKYLRRALEFIDGEARAGRYLHPAALRRVFDPLSRMEQEQLADYLIGAYRFIDYREMQSLFNSMQDLLLATQVSTGKEFDVGEVFEPGSDVAYCEMIRVATKQHLLDNWKILHLNPAEQSYWCRIFRKTTSASEWQIKKFLGIEIPQNSSAHLKTTRRT